MNPDRLDLDSNYINMVNGRCRYIKNMVKSKDQTYLRNEKGFKQSITFPNGYQFIGAVVLSEDVAIFTSNGINGELGLYTDATDSYKPLINRTDLGFAIHHTFKGTYEKNYKGERIIGFTDRSGVPRVINIDNVPNPFTLNKIAAFPDFVVPNIEITNVLDNGGNLPAGSVYIGANYIDEDGTETGFFGFTIPKNIIDDSYSAAYDSIDGAINTLTGKALDITITGIDTTYKFIQLVAIHKVNGITTSRIFKKLPTLATIETSYTGNETFIDVPNIVVLTPRNSYTSAQSITQNNGKLTWGGLTSDDYINLQTVANIVRINYTAKLVNLQSGQKLPTVDVGFMPGEVYAFYLVVRLKNGTAPLAFHIPGRELVAGEYFTVGSGDLIGGIGEVGKTRPNFSTLSGVADIGSGFNTPFAYQVEDTTDNTLAQSNMGYWENRDEFYPSTTDFINMGNGSSTEFASGRIRVRHHRFPTLRKRGISAYNTNTVEIYGINVSNVNLPDDVKAKITGWEIWYAKREYNNATVLGHDLLLYAGGVEDITNTPRTSEIWTTSGNWQLSVVDTDAQGKGIYYNKQYIRMHSPDLLINKPSAVPTYISPQFKLEKTGLNADYSANSNNGRIFFGNDNWVYLIDYARNTNLAISTIANDKWLRAIKDRQYVPHNAVSLPIYNILGEEFVHAKLFGADLGISMNQLTTHPSTSVATLTGEQTMLIAINALRRDVYEAYYNQSLVGIGKLIDKNTTTVSNLFNGDAYVGAFSFITRGPRQEKNVFIEGNYSVKIIRRYIGYGNVNFNLRHQILGNINSDYFPKSAIDTASQFGWPTSLLNVDNPNDIQFNRDYTAKLDLQAPSPFDPYSKFINNFPYRIVQSVNSSNEKRTTGWRTYLPNDTYELKTKSKGPIYNLESMDTELLIHCTKALFITRGKTELQTSTLKVTLGSGDLFTMEPKEISFTEMGYTGTQHWYSCIMTKFGYFWVNSANGKAFLYTGGEEAQEVSKDDVRTFMQEHLYVRADNIMDFIGIAASYEEENERILLCVKNKTLIDSLLQNYAGEYVETQDFIDTLTANVSIVYKDNRYQLFKGLY